jgi:hypothetical protein
MNVCRLILCYRTLAFLKLSVSNSLQMYTDFSLDSTLHLQISSESSFLTMDLILLLLEAMKYVIIL